MKLVNINVGIRIDNTPQIAEYLKESEADIITIQEIVRHLEDTVHPEYQSKLGIERALQGRYPHAFFGPLWITDSFAKNGKAYRSFGGLIEQGNEILSKYPIVGATNEFYYKHYEHNSDRTHWRAEDHGRALQVAELDVEGKRLQVLNVHGIWTEDHQGDQRTINQCEYVIEAAKRKRLPTIIVGDFNLLPDTDSIKIINKSFINLIDKYKIKTTRPDFKDELEGGSNVVDYIFASKDIKVNDFEVVDTDISDHLPLCLEFEIK